MKRALSLLLALAATGLGPLGAGAQAAPGDPQLVALAGAFSFSSPVYVTGAPKDGARLFVVERAGEIEVVSGGSVLTPPFLDIKSLVRDSGGEEGLLSVAFAPDYADSGRFYVYYTNNAGDLQIDEFRRSALLPDRADAASRRAVLTIPHPGQANHNGGQLQFGPDGDLYAATGDGGGGNDPDENAQNLGSLLGKLLRLDPRGGGAAAYRVPADNPFVGQPSSRPEIYAYGLRNPWRFSFDRATGALTIGDVGQGQREEIDYTAPGQGAGANFGWDVFEGTLLTAEGGLAPGHVPPVWEYANDASTCAITGGYVVRDPALPTILGRYLYGDFCAGVVRSILLGTPQATEDRSLGLNVGALASFGQSTHGCVYAVSLNGPVYQLVAPGTPSPVACTDAAAPETTITRAAPAASALGNASFSFVASEAPAGLECRLDGSAWSECSSPLAFNGLAEAPHTFEVRARDWAGNVDPTPAQHGFIVDAAPPETTIASGPSGPTASATVEFGFAASESPASFECRLDSGAWTPCASPSTYAGLADGGHGFEVRATDAAGNTDNTPASRAFEVDTIQPATTMQRAPRIAITVAEATFEFRSNDPTAGFQCRLDQEGWAACASPFRLAAVKEGPHGFEVRARDPAGNVDLTPARQAFAVVRLFTIRQMARSTSRLALSLRRQGAPRWLSRHAIGVRFTSAAAGRLSVELADPRRSFADASASRSVVVARGSTSFKAPARRTLRMRATPVGRGLLGRLRGSRRLVLRVVFKAPGERPLRRVIGVRVRA